MAVLNNVRAWLLVTTSKSILHGRLAASMSIRTGGGAAAVLTFRARRRPRSLLYRLDEIIH